MAWTISTPELGQQAINFTPDTTARHPLGTIVTGYDPSYGYGEFIYLLGVASTIAGSVVTYGGIASSLPTYQTALAPSTANLAQPLAVAMSASVATQFGWYQITGVAIVATNGTLAAGPGPVYISATPGQATSAAANGKQIVNAINCSATGTPAANQALVYLNRIFAQGAIT